jgi:hypothetical protein
LHKTHEARRQDARRSPRRHVDLSDFKLWLAGLDVGVNPTVHVNGHQFAQAILAVDFGQPLRSVKLSSEQSQELVAHMRRLTTEVMGREMNVRVSYDHQHGIYWSAV